MKHSPGPWDRDGTIMSGHLEIDLRLDDKGDNWVTVKGDYHSTVEANASLIEAAPDLVTALAECVLAYEQHRDNQPTGHLWPDPNHIFHARAAIAKAEGGAS